MADVKVVLGDKREEPGATFDKAIEDYLHSSERLKPLLLPDLDKMRITTAADVVANLKVLKATVIEGSRQSNELAKRIVRLTWVLVGLTVVLVGLTVILVILAA